MERLEGLDYVQTSALYIRKSEDLRARINKSTNEYEILELALEIIGCLTGDTLFVHNNLKKINCIENFGFNDEVLSYIYRNFYLRAVKEAIIDRIRKNKLSRAEIDNVEFMDYKEWEKAFCLYIKNKTNF